MDSNNSPEYVLYLRKSKGRAGIARQRTTTTAHVERLGGRVTAEFKDTDRTAYRKPGAAQPRRDGFTAMLAMLAANPGLRVAAWHADRLTRNEQDTAELGRVCTAGGHLIETKSGGSYDLGTANGRKRFRDDASDAMYEVDHNRERVLEKKAEAVAEGRWLGGRRPFGWRPDKDAPGGLILVEAESEPLAQAHRDILDHRSVNAIARNWNAAGVLTSTGARWRQQEVRRVLLRSMNWAPPPAQWPPVVDEDTHRAVAAILTRPERKVTPGPERRHLLSGLARCGVCKGPMVCTSAGNGVPLYRCRNTAGGHVTRAKAALEEYVTAVVIARLSRADARGLLRPQRGSELAQLRRERTATEGLMKESNDLRRRGLLSPAEFADERGEHMERLAGLDQRIAAAEADDVVAPLLGDPAAAWKTRDLDQRRAVISALMTIEVMPAPKGRPKGWKPGDRYFDKNSVRIEPKR